MIDIQHARDWLAAKLQQEAAMTPGPWHYVPADEARDGVQPYPGCDADSVEIPGARRFVCECGGHEQSDSNAAGIAASRNQWRALLLGQLDALAVLEDMIAAPLLSHIGEKHLTQFLARLREAGYTEATDAD